MYEEVKEIGPHEKLTNAEIDRYSRQIIMPEIGMKGNLFSQRLLLNILYFSILLHSFHT
jgi:hypothetical protein